MLSLLEFLNSLLKLVSGGQSPGAPMTAASSTSTSDSPFLLTITRTTKTADALFGDLTIGNDLICHSMERTAVAIPEGSYTAHLRFSPHFGLTLPGIDVPNRTDIEIHPANYPSQLLGCIAVGESIDGDALDNSRAAWDSLMTLLPQSFLVIVKSDFLKPAIRSQ